MESEVVDLLQLNYPDLVKMTDQQLAVAESRLAEIHFDEGQSEAKRKAARQVGRMIYDVRAQRSADRYGP